MESKQVFLASSAKYTPVELDSANGIDSIAKVKSFFKLENTAIVINVQDTQEVLVLDEPDEEEILQQTNPDKQPVCLLVKEIQDGSPNINWGVEEDEEKGNPDSPEWKHDPKCYKCDAIFSWGYGVFSAVKRHHCRNCGASACDSHSDHFSTLKHLGLEGPQRVCDDCFPTLPPDSTDVAVERATAYATTAIAESETYKGFAAVVHKALSNYITMLVTVEQNVANNASAVQHDMAVLSTRLPAVRKSLSDAVELAKHDVPSNNVDHSVITFNYSSPQLRTLATQLPQFETTVVDEESTMQGNRLCFDAVMQESKAAEARIKKALDQLHDTNSHNWHTAISEKIQLQQHCLQRLQQSQPQSQPRDADATDGGVLVDGADGADAADGGAKKQEQERVEIVGQIANVQIELRQMLRTIVRKFVNVQTLVLDCGRTSIKFECALARQTERVQQRETVIDAIDTELAQWHMRRNAVVMAGQRKNQRITGNIHNKLNQQINALTEERDALQTKLTHLEQSTPTPTNPTTTNLTSTKATSGEVASIVADRDALKKEVAALKRGFQQLPPMQDKLKQQLTALKQQLTALRSENQVLMENLKAEQRLNSRRLGDLQKKVVDSKSTAEDLFSNAQRISEERDLLRSHLEDLTKDQQHMQVEAEEFRKRGFNSEEKLLSYHQVLTQIFQTVHPTGGKGEEDRFDIMQNSTLPDCTLRLVEDYVSSSTLISSRCEQLELQLERSFHNNNNNNNNNSNNNTSSSSGSNVSNNGNSNVSNNGNSNVSSGATNTNDHGNDVEDYDRPAFLSSPLLPTPTTTTTTTTATPPPTATTTTDSSNKYASEILRLRAMGLDYAKQRFIQALEESSGDINDAAMLLLA